MNWKNKNNLSKLNEMNEVDGTIKRKIYARKTKATEINLFDMDGFLRKNV